MKTLNSMRKTFNVVLMTVFAVILTPSVNVSADAQCAYNICPRDTSIIFQNGNIAISDVQALALAIVLLAGLAFILNGKRIKASLVG